MGGVGEARKGGRRGWSNRDQRCVSWEEKSVMRLNVVEIFLGARNSANQEALLPT